MKNIYENQILKDTVPYPREVYLDLAFNLHISDIILSYFIYIN